MRLPWFKSAQYKQKVKDLREHRLDTVHWHYALTPTAVEGKLVWLEPFLRDTSGTGFFGGPKFRRRLPDSESVKHSTAWSSTIKDIVGRNRHFYENAREREVFAILPRTCEFSGRLIWMKKCVAVECVHEYNAVDRRYIDLIVLSTARLDGTHK